MGSSWIYHGSFRDAKGRLEINAPKIILYIKRRQEACEKLLNTKQMEQWDDHLPTYILESPHPRIG
jgi:hypothetical protein